jgi:hypothetical protein
MAIDIETAKLIVTSSITVVGAVFAIVLQSGMKKIAERQADTSRQAKEIAAQAKEVATAKLNLDLFERRMVIFELAWTVISYASNGDSYSFDRVGALQNKLHEAYFLFGKDIEDYLQNVRSKAIREQRLLHTIKNEGPNIQQALLDEHQELTEWFTKETIKMRTPFMPYLSFEKWRPPGG